MKRVQDDIISCPNDQPNDDCWLTGSPTYLQDLLMGHKVPERLWDDVVPQLRCPKCASPLHTWQEVGTKPQAEIGHELRIEKALNRHSEKLYEFAKYLRASPYLGALHSTGKRIIKEIGKFPQSSLTNQCWFRARRVDSPIPMTTDDLRPPDANKHKIFEGRFNHFGQACWYLADDPKAAASEATFTSERLTWVQEWKIEQVKGVLDLRAWQAEDDRAVDHDGEPIAFPLLLTALIFGDHLSARPERDSSWRPEYFVPRFVADAARLAGFSGIWFQSTRSYGANLVLFDAQAKLIPIGTPNLICLDQAEAERRDGLFLHQGFPISVSDIPHIGIP